MEEKGEITLTEAVVLLHIVIYLPFRVYICDSITQQRCIVNNLPDKSVLKIYFNFISPAIDNKEDILYNS